MNCRHCGRKIIFDESWALYLGQVRYLHEDLIDGAIDKPNDGASCMNEGETEAEPEAP